MEILEDLRTQLCEEEHKLCDWHGMRDNVSCVDVSVELEGKVGGRRSG